ncbi:MAG: pantoate--beta-alanine ligase [Kiritimatiellales bacterium]|nr:pantoate--beta-alanine ligase [Kiritimatiellales bacterium]
METIHTPAAMQRRALALKREGRVIGFVPTMGFLHEGHLSLMRIARERCDLLVASIFVNPAQFGPNEDLEAYPRDFERDQALCEKEGVDILFFPEAGTMYAENPSVWIDEESLSTVLCGAARPGHFRGVCTVVAKLFNLVLPDIAVFGEKDAQQLRIIERMVRDLDFPVKIIRGPIVREADGLAMSSRNKYLSVQERQDALCLRRALETASELYRNGERQADALLGAMLEIIEAVPSAEVDYLEIVDDGTLQPIVNVDNGALIALAVRMGSTRLIDNEGLENV